MIIKGGVIANRVDISPIFNKVAASRSPNTENAKDRTGLIPISQIELEIFIFAFSFSRSLPYNYLFVFNNF
jgi:hypothetical protein